MKLLFAVYKSGHFKLIEDQRFSVMKYHIFQGARFCEVEINFDDLPEPILQPQFGKGIVVEFKPKEPPCPQN